ncbi:MAG: NAD-dependent epimerase/dehydratase family protein [Acidobacteriota bacterium]
MPRYFVTGATGFLGAELVKQLIGRGHGVAALIRTPEKATLLKALGVELFVGDVTDRESVRRPMQGADGVFHCAAWYRIGRRPSSDLAERVNVEGTRTVLGLAKELAIPRIVYTSTVAVLGDTRGQLVDESYFNDGPFLTEYDRTKWKAHYDVALPMMRDGLPLMIAIPGAIYGPGDTSLLHETLARLLRRRLFITPRGLTLCWGYIEDIARGLRQVMEAGQAGESYLLTGPVHRFDEAFALAARLANRRAPWMHPPPLVMRGATAMVGLLERWNLRSEGAAEPWRLMGGTTWIGSSAKAKAALGFTTRPLDEGLKHTIEHELRQLGMA